MNRSEVRELAQRAGINVSDMQSGEVYMDHLVIFATLVEHQERERCYDLWRDLEIKDQAIIEQIRAAVLYEREQCAQLCEQLIGTRAMAKHCADAIRERTNSEQATADQLSI